MFTPTMETAMAATQSVGTNDLDHAGRRYDKAADEFAEAGEVQPSASDADAQPREPNEAPGTDASRAKLESQGASQ